MKKLKINSDVGEGVFKEDALMPFLNSCSIACGGHYGDIQTMTKTANLAIFHGVNIGAHPSYPDKINFGRKEMFISPNELKDSLHNQISSLLLVLNSLGVDNLDHIKAHGALYHKCFVDVETARSFINVVKSFENVKVLAPYKSVLAKIAKENGVKVDYEVFLDRNYNDDLTLVSRDKQFALINKPKEVIKHISSIIESNIVKTVSGNTHKIKFDTFCVHSDTNNSIEILKEINKVFKNR